MKVPEGPYAFQNDILDEMMIAEDKMIFNFDEGLDYHDPFCKLKKSGPEFISKCC